MKAIIHTAFGAPTAVLQLCEIEQPALGADQVLVRVEAVALAKGDWLITRGLPYIARPSYGLRAPKQPASSSPEGSSRSAPTSASTLPKLRLATTSSASAAGLWPSSLPHRPACWRKSRTT